MTFQGDILSFPTDNVKDHCELFFDFTSMQGATEICFYPELVGETLRLELNLLFLENTLLNPLYSGRLSVTAVEKFGVYGKNI